MGDPTVTVVVPSFNKERFIEATLDSVRRQTFQDLELLVVDDCSTDGSVAVIEQWLVRQRYPCRFKKHEKNMGLCRTMNEAVAEAKGTYLAALGADDIWLPTFLESIVGKMRTLPEDVAVVYGDAEIIDAQGRPGPRSCIDHFRRFDRPPEGRIFHELLQGNFIPAMATLIRLEHLRAVGGYDEELYMEDFDMWLRLAQKYSFAYLPGLFVQYRMAGDSMSRPSNRTDLLRVWQNLVKVYEKSNGLDGQAGKLGVDVFRSWTAAEALYSLGNPKARSCMQEVIRRAPTLRGWVMFSCATMRVPYALFRLIDDAAQNTRDLLDRLGRRVGSDRETT